MTDGVDFEAEDLLSGETVACAYKDFPDHFGFFLPLAGITTVKQITENAFDHQGNQPPEPTVRRIGLPRVNPKNQRRPTMTPKEMTTLLAKAEGQYQMIYFLSLVTGMRISETVAIEIDKHVEPDLSIIYVRQQREKDVNALKPHLKTEAGLRDIDLHPSAARILRYFIGSRKSGYLFQTANGTMLDPGNIDRDSLSLILDEMGRAQVGTRFNVFRRFREAVLQRSEARQILIDYWMGHSNPSMGDRYGRQLVEDVEYRQDQVKKVGLGFDLPPSLFGLRGLQNLGNGHNEEAA